MTEDDKDKIISDIILAFRYYALGDIQKNIKLPISAFTLSCCFLDQLAGFVYNDNHNNRMRRFIKEYLPKYSAMNLDDILRNNLLHNYILQRKLRLAWEQIDFDNDSNYKNLNILNLTEFIADIEMIFESIVIKLNTQGSTERENAIKRDADFPIFRHIDYQIPVYTSDNADKLIEYYSKKMTHQVLNLSGELTVEKIDKKFDAGSGKYFIRVIASQIDNKPQYWRELNDAIKYFKGFNLKSPDDILKN